MARWFGPLGGALLLVGTTATGAAHADTPATAPAATSTATPAATATATEGSAEAPAPPSPTDVDDPTRSAARLLAQEGLTLFDSGKFADAMDRFERASTLVHAPTMGLMAARALEKLGRYVEASERYLAVTRMTLAADASEAFRAALESAAREQEALIVRIPILVIAVSAAAPGVTVTLDGKVVPAALLGAKQPVDPGPHVVVLTHGKTTRTERLLLKEAESRRVVLALDPPPPPPLAPASSTLRTVGWIGVAAGGAGIVLGAVTGGLAITAKSTLDRDTCTDNKCPSSAIPDVESYRTLRMLSGAGLIAGVVTATAGALVVGLSPPSSPRRRQATTWQPWIGPAIGGVRVTF